MLRVTLNKYKDQAALLKDVLQYRPRLRRKQPVSTGRLSLWTARADLEKAKARNKMKGLFVSQAGFIVCTTILAEAGRINGAEKPPTPVRGKRYEYRDRTGSAV
jgi:hypothetical protein